MRSRSIWLCLCVICFAVKVWSRVPWSVKSTPIRTLLQVCGGSTDKSETTKISIKIQLPDGSLRSLFVKSTLTGSDLYKIAEKMLSKGNLLSSDLQVKLQSASHRTEECSLQQPSTWSQLGDETRSLSSLGMTDGSILEITSTTRDIPKTASSLSRSSKDKSKVIRFSDLQNDSLQRVHLKRQRAKSGWKVIISDDVEIALEKMHKSGSTVALLGGVIINKSSSKATPNSGKRKKPTKQTLTLTDISNDEGVTATEEFHVLAVYELPSTTSSSTDSNPTQNSLVDTWQLSQLYRAHFDQAQTVVDLFLQCGLSPIGIVIRQPDDVPWDASTCLTALHCATDVFRNNNTLVVSMVTGGTVENQDNKLGNRKESKLRKKPKRLQLTSSFALEAFTLSNQSLAMYQQGENFFGKSPKAYEASAKALKQLATTLLKKNTVRKQSEDPHTFLVEQHDESYLAAVEAHRMTIHLAKEVRANNQESSAVDARLFAVPVAISLAGRSTEHDTAGKDATVPVLPQFQHIFPSHPTLNQGSTQLREEARGYMMRLLRGITKARGATIKEDLWMRLKDVNLMAFLEREHILSEATFQLLLKDLFANADNRRLSAPVKVELEMYVSMLSSDADSDE